MIFDAVAPASTPYDPLAYDRASDSSIRTPASKAASDLLARSYFVTFKLPVVITRSGPYARLPASPTFRSG